MHHGKQTMGFSSPEFICTLDTIQLLNYIFHQLCFSEVLYSYNKVMGQEVSFSLALLSQQSSGAAVGASYSRKSDLDLELIIHLMIGPIKSEEMTMADILLIIGHYWVGFC